MTAQRQLKLEAILTQPNLTFTHEGINMAENITEGEPHLCADRMITQTQVRPGLTSEPLTDPDMKLFTDGCCFKADT